METRDMRLKKLQLVIDKQSPMRIKPDSLIFLVKRELQEYYVLLNRRQMLREWHTTQHMYHSEIGAQSEFQVADEVLRTDELWWTRQRIHCRNSRQTTCSFEEWQRAKLSHVSHSWKRAVEWWSASCAPGKEVMRTWRRKSCDILKLTVSSIQWSFNVTKRWVSLTCVEKSCTRTKRENSVTICAKNKSSEQRFCRSNTRTHSGTRTMLPDTNRDEHWHTAFSNFTCHSISNASRWICALKIHSATRRQNPNPTFARNSICITFVHVWWISICFDSRSRSASSQTDERMDQWLLVGTRWIVCRTPGRDETWFA